MSKINAAITAVHGKVPEKVLSNFDLEKMVDTNDEWITTRTGIKERRYVDDKLTTSDIATIASERAIKAADIDKEKIDYIIFAHNFGDVEYGSNQYKMLQSLASKVKAKLNINNPSCVCYDLIFGCPGWVEGLIHSFAFMKSGIASKCLVIGSETLSRVVDNHDRDSMIFSDGAGATIIEKVNEKGGIINHKSSTFTLSLIHI